MTFKAVLIGLGDADSCTALADALRRRRHQVSYLRLVDDLDDPPKAAMGYTSAESLFRHHTGTLRGADLIVVSSDVPYQAAVVSWVLDQAGGVVAYCDVGSYAGRAAPPAFDYYVTCRPGENVEQRAAALEQCVSGLVVSAP